MATEAQLTANRANALHSTGPRTAEGKSASSRNAATHGLTARGIIIPQGYEEAFAEFEAGLRDSLQPSGPLQEIIFKRALESAWNLERCRLAAETIHQNNPEIDPLLDEQNEPKYARIHRYAREFEKSLYKAMRELGKLQSEAQFRNEIHTLTEAEAADPELFDTTPQSLSEVCNFTQIVKAHQASNQNEAKTRYTNLKTELEALANLPPQEYIRRYSDSKALAAAAAA